MLAVVFGLVGVTPLVAETPKELPEAATRELKTLKGKWRIEKVLHFDRETTPGSADDPLIFEFKGNTIRFSESSSGTVVELDPSTTPKCLDFSPLQGFGIFKKDSIYESVYKLEGETLSWAVYIGPGKNRPVGFDKPTDAWVKVIVLKRVKE